MIFLWMNSTLNGLAKKILIQQIYHNKSRIIEWNRGQIMEDQLLMFFFSGAISILQNLMALFLYLNIHCLFYLLRLYRLEYTSSISSGSQLLLLMSKMLSWFAIIVFPFVYHPLPHRFQVIFMVSTIAARKIPTNTDIWHLSKRHCCNAHVYVHKHSTKNNSLKMFNA